MDYVLFLDDDEYPMAVTRNPNTLLWSGQHTRGEDTFLSTCLSERKVLRVPCYVFHDGFGSYNHLLSGVLPTRLKPIKADSEHIVKRFYNACIGWTRYKPLLMYITDRDGYESKISEMESNLDYTLPLICGYFDTSIFNNVKKELHKYDKNVKAHYSEFTEIKDIWSEITSSLL